MPPYPDSVGPAPVPRPRASAPSRAVAALAARALAACALAACALAACALAACALAAATPAVAREGDLTRPIDVSAKRSEYDERSGTQTLIGAVEIRQGSMRITADRVTITLDGAKLARIDGSGAPIRFEQENESGGTISGEARQIGYDATSGTLVLTGAATLKQPGQSLTSERIVFDSRSQRVSAEGGEASGRVNIRIEPPPGAAER